MAVTRCHLCQSDTQTSRRHQEAGLESGKLCPICGEPTCRLHLATVRWRWRSDGTIGTDQVCRQCQRTYRHRSWDPINRDWIS